MPYYVGRYIGQGTDANPFRPRGVDGQVGWSAVDLRDDGSTVGSFNACLVFLPVPVSDPQLELIVDSPDENLSQSQCNRLNNFLGTSVAPGPFRDIVGEIMMFPPPAKWKALQATRDRFLVWLNGLLFNQPVISGGSEAHDDFDRPDTTNEMGARWVFYIAGASLPGRIVNGRVQAVSTAAQMEGYWQGFIGASADMFAECQLALWNGTAGSDSTIGSMIRCDTTAARTFYELQCRKDSSLSQDGWVLFKRVSGANTNLGNNANDPFVTGDRVQIQAIGSTITGKRNWVTIVQVTDTELATQVRGGMRVGNINDVTATEADNFLVGDGPIPKKFFIVPGGGAEPDSSMVVDTFDRVENPLTDISPITGLARWSLASTQPIFPDDDVSSSFEIRADGAHARHCQFGLQKGCYRLDYQYGAEVQVGYEITGRTPGDSGLFGAVLRISNPGTNSISGYQCDMPRVRIHTSTNDEWRVWRIDPGSPYTRTQIGSSFLGANIGLNDLVCAQAVKDKIQLWRKPSGGSWEIVLEVTDSTYSGPGYAGFYLNGTGEEGGNDPNTGLPVDQARINDCFIGWRKFILSH